MAAAHLGPREGLCPPPRHRPQQHGGIGVPGVAASRASQLGFRSCFGNEFPTLPCCSAGWLGGCQDLQAPPAYSPAVPEPPPPCQLRCLSQPRRRGTPGCCGRVAPSPSSPLGPHLPGVFVPCTSQALPGTAVSSRSGTPSQHHLGGMCSPTSSLLEGDPEKPLLWQPTAPRREPAAEQLGWTRYLR